MLFFFLNLFRRSSRSSRSFFVRSFGVGDVVSSHADFCGDGSLFIFCFIFAKVASEMFLVLFLYLRNFLASVVVPWWII